MTKTRISMLTCPGRELFMKESLRSLMRSSVPDDAEKVVYSDGGEPFRIEGWRFELLSGHTPVGNLRAFIKILHRASIENIDLLIYLEDDIAFTKNAIERMIAVAKGLPTQIPFATFFDMKEFFPGAPEGLYRVPLLGLDGRGLWGMQALAIRRPAIEAFLSANSPKERLKQGWTAHSDIVFAEALKESGYTHYVSHIPCLVEHVGYADSAIWNFASDKHEICRRATNWKGENFDASSCKF